MSDLPEFVPVPEAAEAAGVSERTMWRWIRDGRVETLKVGRRLFVRPPDRPAPGGRVSETAAAYQVDPGVEPISVPGAWPFTRERLVELQERLGASRRAAAAEMDRLAAGAPRGELAGLIREVKDEDRAWDGLRRGEREMRNRARRRDRQ